MMERIIVFIGLLLAMTQLHGQTKLYYFISTDSSGIGVKDEFGKVIIPAIFPSGFWNDQRKSAIKTETIEFYSLPNGQMHDFSKPATATGGVYNRLGELLYQPQYFDNGPDYWYEGLRRYVVKGKMGFVNKSGLKITAPNFDFAEPFHYGYAKVYQGDLKKIYDSFGEHWSIGSNGKVVSFLINNKGKRVEGYKKAKHPKDYYYEGLYYPYPFHYTEAERKVLNQLEQYTIGVNFYCNSNVYKYQYKPLQIEITERPSAYQPYYVLRVFQNRESKGEIYVDALSKKPFVLDYDGIRVDLREACVQSLKEFLSSSRGDILPETRKIAEKELQKLKSHP